ncbi:MAG: type VI secretion system lipoprotein TssJ [Gammaproteobacteria bacterium]
MTVLHRTRLTAIAFCIATFAGCSSLNSKVGGALNLDTDVTLTFIASKNINPDESGRPSPLFVRVYELKSARQFERANFIDLYERETQVLGAELLGKQTLKPLKPGDERKDKFVINPEANYVGLVAEFLQYKNAKFKVVIPVASKNVIASSSTVRISGNSMSIDE